jgi:Flp pilus assembly protein TadD
MSHTSVYCLHRFRDDAHVQGDLRFLRREQMLEKLDLHAGTGSGIWYRHAIKMLLQGAIDIVSGGHGPIMTETVRKGQPAFLGLAAANEASRIRVDSSRGDRMRQRTVKVLLVIALASTWVGCFAVKSGDELVQDGIRLFEAGNFVGAIAKYDSALEADTRIFDEWEIYKYLGAAYDGLGKFSEAIEAYDRSIAADPGHADVWVNRGVSYRQTGDLDLATESYDRALELDPENAEAHTSIGVIHILSGDAATAVEYLERSIELDPTQGVSHGNLAFAYGLLGRFDDADESLARSVELGYVNASVVDELLDDLRGQALTE